MLNSPKEQLVLNHSVNFERQLCNFDTNRVLLLRVFNEFGLEKLICSFIHPTKLTFSSLDSLESIVHFVSDFLEFDRLDPFEMPKKLQSQSKTFKNQKANIYEFCIALCSLLIGASYNAFIVFGRVCRQLEVILIELSENCNQNGEEVLSADELKSQQNYAWILLKLSDHEMKFIDPVTGTIIPLEVQNDRILKYFSKIESVCNHTNYWVNMSRYSTNTENDDASFDFNDRRIWLPLLDFEPVNVSRLLEIKAADIVHYRKLLESNCRNDLEVDSFWNPNPVIGREAFQMRYPGGRKEIRLKYQIIEHFAPYLDRTGMIKRISYFDNDDDSKQILLEVFYINREDCLVSFTNKLSLNSCLEEFKRGRLDGCQSHEYLSGSDSEGLRIIRFYENSRADCIIGLDVSEKVLKEIFSANQKNGLIQREYFFKNWSQHQTVVEKIVERFDANKPSAYYYREFRLLENQIRIELPYLSRDKITTTLIHFRKPQIDSSTMALLDEQCYQDESISFTDKLIIFYYKPTDSSDPNLSRADFYTILSNCLKDEKFLLSNFSARNTEISDFKSKRISDFQNPLLINPVIKY